ncbi:MAG: choice-of-anchor D domain-containing protein [bacterium]
MPPAQAVPILPLQFSPAAVQFGTVTLGESSSPSGVTLRLRNPAETFGPMRLQLSDPQHFQIVADTCTGSALSDAAECSVEILFKPDLFGHYSSFLVVVDEQGGLGNFVPLEGTGAESGFPGPPAPVAVDTSVAISAEQVVFASQSPGTTSAPQGITLINTGSSELRVQANTFGGDAPFNFARLDSCMPKLIPPGGTCNITTWFTPLTPDPALAALAIAANVADSPLVVALSGNGASLAASGGGCALAGGMPANSASPWLGLAYSLLVFGGLRRLK